MIINEMFLVILIKSGRRTCSQVRPTRVRPRPERLLSDTNNLLKSRAIYINILPKYNKSSKDKSALNFLLKLRPLVADAGD